MSLPETFKALSDPTRREILKMLRDRPLSAGEIGERFPTAGATISHHLSVLKSADLVFDRHEGKHIIYELNLSVFEELMNWFQDFTKKEESKE